MEFLFRFGKPRMFQESMVHDIYDALEAHNDILVNAPTGIGKTDASLGAALTFALERGLDVFFLTPKISQHKIAVDVLSGIKKKFRLDFGFVDIVGKQGICINDKVNAIESEAFYSACENLVKKGKCAYFSKAKGFDISGSDASIAMEDGHNSLLDFSYKNAVCSYEIAAKLAKTSRVVIAGYSQLLNPYNKGAFLKKIGHSLDNAIVIWDEAHNLINVANSYFSTEISEASIDRAAKELKEINSTIDLDYLKFEIKKIAQKKLSEKVGEAFVSTSDIPEGITSESEKLTDMLDKAGLEYVQAKDAKRSAILHVSKFLKGFLDADESSARIVSEKFGKVRLRVSCLYPERSLPIFQEAYSNVFMSATLEPMNMYSDLFGLNNAVMKNYSSPFPKSNRIAVIDREFTTKYQYRSVEQYKLIAAQIEKIKGTVPGNVAVFFPSFAVLDGVARYINGFKKYTQTHDMGSVGVEGIIKRFTAEDNALLLAVMGGSLSEGVDYPNNAIKGIVVVGIPLAMPDLELKAKIAYLDIKFAGKGVDYAYIIPAVIRSVQAAGRAVRSEKDRAVMVFMDKRYAWRMYRAAISNAVTIDDAEDYIRLISDFWRSGDEIDKVVAGKPNKDSEQ